MHIREHDVDSDAEGVAGGPITYDTAALRSELGLT